MSDELTPDEKARRRKNAVAQLAAGSTMVGAGSAAMQQVKNRTGLKSALAAVKDANKQGVKAAHGKYAAGWLATRGAIAAGAPLAASGAAGLIAKKPQTEHGVDIKRDVVGAAVERTLPNLPKAPSKDDIPKPRKAVEQAARAAPLIAGATAGGIAGRKLASIGRARGSKSRLLGLGMGTAVGTAFGSAAAGPTTSHITRRATKGKHDYDPQRGFHKVEKMKSTDAAIKELPGREQDELLRRKRKQTALSLTSAGLGATALGLKAPSLAGVIARRAPKAPKAIHTFAGYAPKADKLATNVGIGSLGVGSVGSLNFARTNKLETKADQKVVNKTHRAQHNEDLAKALVPRVPRFQVAPTKFGGVRPATMARIQTPTGMKTVLRRGSTGRSALA